MTLTAINLVVEDLARSAVFYRAWGWSFRPITLPGSDEAVAWTGVAGPSPLTLHSVSFAAWWDPEAPEPDPGSLILDLLVDSVTDLTALTEAAVPAGGRIRSTAREMPWGQWYAIVSDPDGYRWGLKAPIDD